MYAEDTTYEELGPSHGILFNGKKYAILEPPELSDDNVVLVPWERDWDKYSVDDDDVMVLTKNEVTQKLQSHDIPLNTW